MKSIIIPARKNSKRRPNKNFDFFYKDNCLVDIALDFAFNVGFDSEVILSTDNIDYNTLARDRYPQLKVVDRHDNLSTSSCPTSAVIKDLILNKVVSDTSSDIIILQPTSPIRFISDIVNANSYYDANKLDLLFSVCNPVIEPNDILLEDRNGNLVYKYDHDKTPWFETGQFYFCSITRILEKTNPFKAVTNKNIFPVENISFIDIDNEFQYQLARIIYNSFNSG